MVYFQLIAAQRMNGVKRSIADGDPANPEISAVDEIAVWDGVPQA